MKPSKSDKKGQISIGQLAGLAVTFVIVTIVVAFGATIVSDVQATQCTGNLNLTDGQCYINAKSLPNETEQGLAWNTSSQGLQSLEKFGTNLPTLAIVVVAAVIIGVLASAFVLSR